MLSHEMHMKIIANDRYSARLTDAEACRLARTYKRSRSMVTLIGQLVVDFVTVLASVI